jgi:hypothetical protein
MGNLGVSFVDEGGERVSGTMPEQLVPSEPSGSGARGLEFVDARNSDISGTAYDPSKQGNLDSIRHDETSGPDFRQVDEAGSGKIF